MPFAIKMVELLPHLLRSAEGKPEVPDSVDELEGPQVFEGMPWQRDQGWAEKARLDDVVHYLRGNTRLCLPDFWRAVLPRRL